MAFNINAAVVLSGPKNIQKVRGTIQKQLQSISVPVDIKLNKGVNAGIGRLDKSLKSLNTTLATLNTNATRATTALNSLGNAGRNINTSANQINRATNAVNKSLNQAAQSASAAGNAFADFGKDAALAVRRFAAFSAATGVIFGFTRAVTDAVGEAIKFERELVKITQVTGASGKNLEGFRRTVDQLSGSLGISAGELLEVGRTFAQTGQSIEQVRKSLTAVSRASLAPTFGDIRKTTEGAIAALNQFNLEASELEGILGSLNQVSKRFAVESDDLISVIRRAGGVFAASSQQLGAPEERLRELLGIFTAVRSTTRESADTIATGLRTIFTRIQRPQTIEFLKQFGVQIRATAEDAQRLGIAEGQFVGIFEALRQISKASQGLDTLQTARLVEELGGVRQVGKLLPALRNFEVAEKAVQEALKGRSSIAKDVGLATDTLAVQIQNLGNQFERLIRDVSESRTFQSLARTAISTASAFITLADALRPILPALTAIAAVKLGGATFEALRGFAGGFRKGGGAGAIGANLGSLATGGSAAQQTANQKQAASSLKSNTSAISANTSALKTLNSSISSLQRTSTTLNTTASSLSSTLQKLPAQIATAARGRGITGAPIPLNTRRRRAAGGTIPKFKDGGFVKGASHAQGGVVAELEGGEFVVPKKQAKGFAFGGLTRNAVRRPGRNQLDDIFQPNTAANAKFPLQTTTAFSRFLNDVDLPGSANAPKAQRFGNLPPRQQKELVRQFRSRGQSSTGAGAAATKGSSAQNVRLQLNPGKFAGLFLTGTGSAGTGQGAGIGISGKAEAALIKKAKSSGFRNAANITIGGPVSQFISDKNERRQGIDEETAKAAQDGFEAATQQALNSKSLQIGNGTPFKVSQQAIKKAVAPLFKEDKGKTNSAQATIQGYLLEGIIGVMGNITPESSESNFDFLFGKGSVNFEGLADFFGQEADLFKTLTAGDAKRQANSKQVSSIFRKSATFLANNPVAGNANFIAARNGRSIPGQGMTPVRVSNGEGVVAPNVASGNLADLERARRGDQEAISRVANLPISRIKGAGTGTSDSIEGALPANSFVLPAKTIRSIDNRAQNLRVGGVVRGVGSALKRDPGTAIFLGLEGSLLATSESAEEFKANLINAALGLAFIGPQLKEFAADIKKATASAAKNAAVVNKSARAQSKFADTQAKLSRRSKGLDDFISKSTKTGTVRNAQGRFVGATLDDARRIGRTGQTKSGRAAAQGSIRFGKELLGRESGVAESGRAFRRAARARDRRLLFDLPKGQKISGFDPRSGISGKFSGGGRAKRAAIEAAQNERALRAAERAAAKGGSGTLGRIPKAGLGRSFAGGASKLLGGPGGIAALLASLFGDAAVDAVSTVAVGRKTNVAGVSGFSAEQGGLRTAQVTGGAKGAISGAATGALIGSFVPVIGTAVGAAVGGVLGGIFGSLDAGKTQLTFESLSKVSDAANKLTSSLDTLSQKGFDNVQALNDVTDSSRTLTASVISTADELGRLRTDGRRASVLASGGGTGAFSVSNAAGIVDRAGSNFSTLTRSITQVEGTGLEKLGNQFGALTDTLALAEKQLGDELGGGTGGKAAAFALRTVLPAVLPAGLGNLVSATNSAALTTEAVGSDSFEQRAQRSAARIRSVGQQVDAEDFRRSLTAIPNEALQAASQSFDALGPAIVESIGLDDLTELANLGEGANFDDLVGALERAGDGSERFKQQLEALQGLAGTQAVAQAKILSSTFAEIAAAGEEAGRSDVLESLFTVGENAAETFVKGINSGQSFEEAANQAGANFITKLQDRIQDSDVNFESLGIENLEQLQAKLAENPALLNQVANGLGVLPAELNSLINSTDSYLDSVETLSTEQLRAAGRQAILNDLIRAQVRNIDAFAAALEDLDGRVGNIISDFTTTASNVQQEVARIFSTQQDLSAVGRANVFEGGGRGRSRDELGAGVSRVRTALGGDPADFSDLADTITLGNRLPQAVKDTVDQINRAGGEFTFEEARDILLDNINADGDIFSGLSDAVQGQLLDQFEQTFTGSRQGGTTGAIGVPELENILQRFGGVQEEFSQLSQKTASTLENITNNLNSFNAAILESANLVLESSRQRTDAELDIAGRRASFEDQFSQFRTGGPDQLSTARRRLQQRTDILLNAGGAGTATVNGQNLAGVGGGDLLQRRAGLENIRRELLDSIGEVTSVDTTNPDDAIAAAQGVEGADELINSLGNVNAALEGTKRAIEEQTNETARLSAIENKLASINESRLSQRQRLQAGLSQLSGARNQGEVNKILNEIQRPLVAATKAQAGQTLSVQEAAALQADLFDQQGIVATSFRQQNPNATDEDVAAFLEKSLANFQEGGRNLFSNLGLGQASVDAAFGRSRAEGGLGATARGETDAEKSALSEAEAIVKQQTDLIAGFTEQNTDLLAKQQQIYRDEIIKTVAALQVSAEAFGNLRDKQQELLELAGIRAAQLEGTPPPAGTAQRFANEQTAAAPQNIPNPLPPLTEGQSAAIVALGDDPSSTAPDLSNIDIGNFKARNPVVSKSGFNVEDLTKSNIKFTSRQATDIPTQFKDELGDVAGKLGAFKDAIPEGRAPVGPSRRDAVAEGPAVVGGSLGSLTDPIPEADQAAADAITSRNIASVGRNTPRSRQAARIASQRAALRTSVGVNTSIGEGTSFSTPSDDVSRGRGQAITRNVVQQETQQERTNRLTGNNANTGGSNSTAQVAQTPDQDTLRTLADSINQLTSSTFATELLQAANKLENLGSLEVTFNGTITPIEVILNGASLFREVRDNIKQELIPLIQQAVSDKLNDINL